MEGEIIHLDGRVEPRRTKKSHLNLMQVLNQYGEPNTENRSVNSMFTNQYYEASQLPNDWYEESELNDSRGRGGRGWVKTGRG